MNARKTILCLAAALLAAGAAAQSRSNYGTEKATALYEEANSLMKSKKYDQAKVLFERVLATGDQMYAGPASKQINFINGVLAKGRKQAPMFSISDDNIELAYLGGTYPVIVDGAESWNVSPRTYNDWCAVEVDRKKNKILINVAPNESTEERDALLTVTTKSGQKKTIRVKNAGAPEVLRSSAQNLTFTPEGETNVVDIDANTDWEVSDVPEWLNAIKGIKDIQFTAKPNDANRDRIAQVRVETPSKNEITINIIQSAALDSLAFSKNNLHFGPDGGDEYITVLTDAEDWRFGDFPHWCQLTRVDDRTILVHCTPNEPYGVPREASVNVTTGNQTLGVHVSQDLKPIVNVIPPDGIGGRAVSFGFSAGYLYPMIYTSASTPEVYSAVNYHMGSKAEEAGYSSNGGFMIGAHVDVRLYKNLYLDAGLNFVYYTYRNSVKGEAELILPGGTDRVVKGDAAFSFKEDYTMMSLDVPVLASYRIPLNRKSNFRINLGPVLGIGLSSKLRLSGNTDCEKMLAYQVVNGQMTNTQLPGVYKSHLSYSGSFDMFSKNAELTKQSSIGSENASVKEESHFDAAPFNRVNFGLRFGLGYEFMGINLTVSYQWMVTDRAADKFWSGDRWDIFRRGGELMKGYSQHDNLLMVTLGYTFRY